ncbi:hypothetical protein [Actinomadura rudentiformis]|uniref:Uncharacterized protein n=1 Tax=Actinomadura rudentiformis TaxID=359158 RepID=A0A6H9YPT2_9ACTN|nr:hypothetical protein [Actinomadura rudentiformis]KAB2348367.1 hypothetical protein F8566_16370 [Actinomadura rudentiformis]
MTTARRPDEEPVNLTKAPSEGPAQAFSAVPGPSSAPARSAAPPHSATTTSSAAPTGSGAPARSSVPAGPAWIVVPARIVALVIVLPIRLVYDLLVVAGRGLKAGSKGVLWALAWPFRQLYTWLLRPLGLGIAAVGRAIGIGLAWAGSGLAWLFNVTIVSPLGWLLNVVVLGFLRMFGRGSGRLGRWFYRTVLAPIGRFSAYVGRGVGAGLLATWRGLLWLLNVLIVAPLSLVGGGLKWLLVGAGHVIAYIAKGVATGIAWLFAVLIVLPLALLWQYVLRPPLAGLAWLCRLIGSGLAYVGRGIGTGLLAGWRATAGALGWAWRMAGRILRWLGRVLFVIPALAIWNYVLRPVLHGLAEGARMAGRFLRWLWNALVADPARWVRNAVLRPAKNVVRETWRITVREPARWMNASIIAPVRQTGRDVRLQLRRSFRRT